MNIFQRIRSRWWEHCRQVDRETLWPALKEQAKDLDRARDAFMLYATLAPCWVRHYKEGLWIEIRGMT